MAPTYDRLNRRLTLPNDVEAIPQLNEYIDTVAEELGLDMSLTMSLNLALEEAVVNVMSYAYPTGTVGEVVIDVQRRVADIRYQRCRRTLRSDHQGRGRHDAGC